MNAPGRICKLRRDHSEAAGQLERGDRKLVAAAGSAPDCTKVKVRVEHRVGEVVAATVIHGYYGYQMVKNHLIPAELGDPEHKRPNNSKRTQAPAAIPREEIEGCVTSWPQRDLLVPSALMVSCHWGGS